MLGRSLALVVVAAVVAVSTAAADSTAYLDMSTPRSSVRSYAAALRAARWQDACSHHSRVERTGDYRPCLEQLASLGAAAAQLRVTILGVERAGRYADVRYRSTLGFSEGTATLVLRHGRWLISGFLPARA
jgi:hypothetical protein